jgi:hypothetical protein
MPDASWQTMRDERLEREQERGEELSAQGSSHVRTSWNADPDYLALNPGATRLLPAVVSFPHTSLTQLREQGTTEGRAGHRYTALRQVRGGPASEKNERALRRRDRELTCFRAVETFDEHFSSVSVDI